ncbi:MAG: hypothetical protein HRF45_13930 [Fimbriimonadia bacterium]|jgi:hypothetical protein
MSKGMFRAVVRLQWLLALVMLPGVGLSVPSVTINSPTGTGTIGGDVRVSFTLSGGVGLMNWVVEVRSTDAGLGYTNVASGTATNSTVSATWSSAGGGFPDANDYEIRVTATDTVPSSGQNSVTGVVLNNTTYIRLDNPTDSATVGGLVRAVGAAGDSWTLRWDGLTNAATGSAGNINNDLNSTTLSDGPHTLVLTVTNQFGDVSTLTRALAVRNNVDPVVKITAPAENAGVKGTVKITGSARHPDATASVTLRTDLGATLYSGVGPTHTINVDWDTVAQGVPDGLRTLTLLLTDASGNENRAVVNVTVDNTGPQVSFSVTPTPGGFGKGTLDISGTVTDTNLDRWNITVDGGTSGVFPNSGTESEISSKWNTQLYSEGSHVVRVVAFDKSGNQGSSQVTVITDNIKPTASLTSPAANTVVKGGNIVIEGTASDANFDRWELAVDDGTTGLSNPSGTTNTVSSNLDTSSLGEGKHEIKLTAFDKAGNTQEAIVSFDIDKIAPNVDLTAPLADAFVRGIAPITGTVIDSNLDTWTVRIDGVVDIPNNTGTTGSISVDWDTRVRVGGVRRFPDGPHTIDVTARDKAGNVATLVRNIKVDNTSPSIENIQPEADSFVGESVLITANVVEQNLDKWTVTVDGEELDGGTGNSSGIEVDWFTSTYSEGRHTIQIVATDKAGNTDTKTVSVTIDRTAPQVFIRYPFNNFVVAPNTNLLIVVDITDLSDLSVDEDSVSVVLRGPRNNVVAKADKLSSTRLAAGNGIRWTGQLNVGKGGGKVGDKFTIEATAMDKAGNGPATAKKTIFIRFQ